MRRLLLSSFLVVPLLLIGAPSADANAPAPWWACEGRMVGSECTPYGGGGGVCELQANCTDDVNTTVDECLYCEGTGDDGCAGAAPLGAAGAAALGLGMLSLLRRRRE